MLFVINLVVLVVDASSSKSINTYWLASCVLFLGTSSYKRNQLFTLLKFFAERENILSNKSDHPICNGYPYILRIRDVKKMTNKLALLGLLFGLTYILLIT
jgi:hypothetical protein